MKKTLNALAIGRFQGGDLRLVGSSTCFQGHISTIETQNGGELKILLLPYAEKSQDGHRWTRCANPHWKLMLAVTNVVKESADHVVLKTSEGETALLFLKGHREGLDYKKLGEDSSVEAKKIMGSAKHASSTPLTFR